MPTMAVCRLPALPSDRSRRCCLRILLKGIVGVNNEVHHRRKRAQAPYGRSTQRSSAHAQLVLSTIYRPMHNQHHVLHVSNAQQVSLANMRRSLRSNSCQQHHARHDESAVVKQTQCMTHIYYQHHESVVKVRCGGC